MGPGLKMSQKSDQFPLGQELDLIIKYLRVDAFMFGGGVGETHRIQWYSIYIILFMYWGERLG